MTEFVIAEFHSIISVIIIIPVKLLHLHYSLFKSCVSLGSEASMRLVMEKIPKIELHGQVPVVTYASKTALIQFEAQVK